MSALPMLLKHVSTINVLRKNKKNKIFFSPNKCNFFVKKSCSSSILSEGYFFMYVPPGIYVVTLNLIASIPVTCSYL